MLKQVFLMVFFVSFVQRAHAYNFSLECLKEKQFSHHNDPLFRCIVRDIDDGDVAAFITASVTKDKTLSIVFIQTCPTYQKRNLSNVLLYQAIKVGAENFNIEKVTLLDVSSVSDQTRKPHYARYGFKKVDGDRYQMGVYEFLNASNNLKRYDHRHDEDTIDIKNKLEEVSTLPSTLCRK